MLNVLANLNRRRLLLGLASASAAGAPLFHRAIRRKPSPNGRLRAISGMDPFNPAYFTGQGDAFTFTPRTNEVGTVQFDFTATDKDGASAPATLSVTVCAPPPVTDFGCPTNGAAPSLGVATTLTNLTYALEYTTNLLEVPPVWVQVDSEAGNGGEVTLQDGTAAGVARYYRIVIP